MKKGLNIILLIILPTIIFSESITLEKSIVSALKNNISLEIQKIENENQKSIQKSNYWNLLPNGSVSYSENYDEDFQKSSESKNLAISKTLSWDESSIFSIYRGKKQLKISELSLKRKIQNTVYTTFTYYLNLIKLKEKISIQKEYNEIAKRDFEEIKVLKKMGKKTDIDLKDAEISLLNSQIALENQKINLESDILAFEDYTNLKIAKMELIKPEFNFFTDFPEYKENIEIKKNILNIENQLNSLFQSKLSFFPDLSVSGSISNSENNFFEDYVYGFSMNLSYAFDSFPKQLESYKREKKGIRISELNLKQQKNNLKLSYKKDKLNWENSIKQYEITKKKVALSKSKLQLAREMFKLGNLKMNDYEEAKYNYKQSKIDLLDKYYSLWLLQEEINLNYSRKILNKY